jgi:DNA-binding NarL/FixJ family response regulator
MSSRRRNPNPHPRIADSGLDQPPLPPGLTIEIVEVGGEALVVFELPRVRPSSLSEAETCVVNLVLQGLTTAQIAVVRDVARATIASQLQSIYRKLGVASRAELACKMD